MKTKTVNIPLLIIVILGILLFGTVGVVRLDIDTDVSRTLPAHEPVIADALEIFRNHPIHDQVAVDIMVDRNDPELLVQCSKILKEKMQRSGLFVEVGLDQLVTQIPQVQKDAIAQLPLLFTAQDLAQQLAPRLKPDAIDQRLMQTMRALVNLDTIGQAATLATDPLGFAELVLARMSHLSPSPKGRIYQGNLISQDDSHLLLTAKPKAAGSNTESGRKIAALFDQAEQELNHSFGPTGVRITLTPTGAYRAALDNERIIRHDVQVALGLATASIALLLLLAFPRPLFSLLSLVPPIAGTAMAVFVYSLFHESISIMVLGFSGALISIMDDFSITYLLFLDRPKATRGQEAADEVQSVGGTMALFTTIASFVVLGFSDFPVFAALGEFTALGLIFTYLFIHFVSPRLLPLVPPAKDRQPPLHKVSGFLFSLGKPGFFGGIFLMFAMLFFAKPHFHMSLRDMNTVSEQTTQANQLFEKTWGGMTQKVYLMIRANSLDDLQQQNDALQLRLAADQEKGIVHDTFVVSMLYPGPEQATRNRKAWRDFWTQERSESVIMALRLSGQKFGFTEDAFTPFLRLLQPDYQIQPMAVPESLLSLLGITEKDNGQLVQFTSTTPGPAYNGDVFRNAYGRLTKIFDSANFSDHLTALLFATFMQSLTIMAVVISLILLGYFLSWRLTFITLLPLVFAYIATLGTLHLLGRPLDIPGLMLTVVILGLGIDYTIYTVCGYQRYGTGKHPNFTLLRSAVLLSATSTLLGFGALCFADHATLKSVGITSLCGIGYSLLGTLLLLPPLLDYYFRTERQKAPAATPALRILDRYRNFSACPRLTASFKLRKDPLLVELAELLEPWAPPDVILDIGCGYGVPACWCLERYPQARLVGFDPDSAKTGIAQTAVQERGVIVVGAAPQLPKIEGVDLILMLDMIHYLDDSQLQATLRQCRALLAPSGLLLARCHANSTDKRSYLQYLAEIRAKSRGMSIHYRNQETLAATVAAGGFSRVRLRPSARPDCHWLVAMP